MFSLALAWGSVLTAETLAKHWPQLFIFFSVECGLVLGTDGGYFSLHNYFFSEVYLKRQCSLCGFPGWGTCQKKPPPQQLRSAREPQPCMYTQWKRTVWFLIPSSHSGTCKHTRVHTHTYTQSYTRLHKERMREILKRRLQHQWLLPNLYLIFCWADMLVSIATLGGLDNTWS